jgi:hypothetical protein
MTALLRTRIRQDRITAKAMHRDRPPAGIDWDGHEISADWWDVTLTMDGRTMTVPFGMGPGHNGRQPSAEDVLECLLSDAASWENAADYADWLRDYGMEDGDRAKAVYRQIGDITKALRRLLGDRYDTYLWDTGDR